MKTRALIVSVLSLSAGLSLADQLYHPSNPEEGAKLRFDHMPATSRAAVEQDVMAAQRDGSLMWISRGYPARYPLQVGPTLKNTRSQVVDEMERWRLNPVTPDGLRMVQGELGWTDAKQAPGPARRP